MSPDPVPAADTVWAATCPGCDELLPPDDQPDHWCDELAEMAIRGIDE